MNHYPRHIGDWMRDTAHLSEIEECMYSRCIDQYYSREKALPLDLAQCARLVRAASAAARKALATILPEFFIEQADGWHQKRCDEELALYKVRADLGRRNGLFGGRPRTENKPTKNREITENVTDEEPKPKANHKPVTSNQELPKTKAARKRAIPADFALSDEVRAWGTAGGIDNLDPYLEIFIARNKASGKTYIDWDQAFMNAVREDWYELRKPDGHHGSGRESRIAEQERVIDALTGKRKGRTIDPVG